MIELGTKVKDKITGFEGIATARVQYLTGCTQIGVSQPLDKDGKIPDTVYFDHIRLDVIDEKPIFEKEETNLGGPNRDCPKR